MNQRETNRIVKNQWNFNVKLLLELTFEAQLKQPAESLFFVLTILALEEGENVH